MLVDGILLLIAVACTLAGGSMAVSGSTEENESHFIIGLILLSLAIIIAVGLWFFGTWRNLPL